MPNGFIKLSKKIFLISFFLSAVLASIILYSLFIIPNKTEAVWFNDNWGYRKAISTTIASNSSDISNLQMLLTVDTSTGANGIGSGKMQSSCQDLRFTNTNGKILPYYIDSGCTTTTTKIWVMVDLVPKNTTSMTLYMYYGNPSAPAGSNSQPYFDNVVGLVGYWTLNDGGSSATASDHSVNGNTGTLTIGATGTQTTATQAWTNGATGQYSGSLNFDGTDDYVSSSSNLGLTGDITSTLSVWVKFNSVAAGQEILQAGNGNTSLAGMALYVGVNGSGSISVEFFGSNGARTASGVVTTGQWYHITATKTPGPINTTTKLYINGALQTFATSATATPDVVNGLMYAGAGHTSSMVDYLNGSVDDVKIYNTARTAAQILNDYNNKLPNGQTLTIASTAPTTVIPTTSIPTDANAEKAPSPVAYWKFDDSQGQTAQDSTINNNDGTLGATSGSESSDPTWQTEDMCVSGKCLKFDGGDYTKVAHSSSINFERTDSFTLQAWVKFNSLSAFRPIIAKQSTSPDYRGYILYIDNNAGYENTLSLLLRNTGGNALAVNTTATLSANQWYHVVATYDGSSTPGGIKIYIDGKQQSTSTPANTLSATITNTNNLGVGSRDSLDIFHNGFIDDVKIYPYARSAAQVLTDYNARSSNEGISADIGSSGSSDSFGFSGSLSNGLVGYWKMDESSWTNDCSTTTVTDSSGNGNNGKSCPNAAGTQPVAGKFGNGGSFDGSNDYVTIAHSAAEVSSNWTIGGWVYPRSCNGGMIYSKTDNGAGYYRDIYSSTTFSTNYSTSAGDGTFSSTTSCSVNTWTHVILSYDSSSRTFIFYINGNKDNSTTLSSNLSTKTVDSIFASFAYNNHTSYFNGLIDEFRIYNRALSSSEVSALYNFAPGPVGYWKMDEASWNGTSGEVKDASGNGNNGTGSGGVTTTNTGKYGKAGNFDGSGDYVSIADNTNLRPNQITLSAWVKGSSQNAYAHLISKYNDSSGGSYALYTGSSGGLFFYVTYNTGANAVLSPDAGTSYWNNQWHHVVGIYDGSYARLYVDGVQIGSGTAGSVTIQYTANPLYIASHGAGYYFNGTIDDVKIYNYAQTQKQIIEDMGGGHPGVLASSSWNGGAAGAIGSRGGGPVAYYKFDEGHSTTANNSGSGGSTLNGTLTSMATSPSTSTSGWTQAGKFNRGLNFDGSDDYVNMGDILDSSVFAVSNAKFSISVWSKTTTLTTLQGSGNIITKSAGGGGPYEWIIYHDNDGYIKAFVSSDSSASNYVEKKSSTTISTNSWFHAVLVFDGTQSGAAKVQLYVNGLVGIASRQTGLLGSSTADTAQAITVGATSASANQYTGTIDEVKIYSYALTADEVKLDYNKGSAQVLGALSDNSSSSFTSSSSVQAADHEYCIPGDSTSCASPVGRWDFEEGTGSTVNDTSGNANTGTWNGTLGNQWKTGKIGKAGNFNGSDNYVSVPDASSLRLAASFSAGGWVKTTSSDSNARLIVAKWVTGSGLDYWLGKYNATTIAFYVNGTTNVTANLSLINDGKWHYVIGVADAAASLIRIYVDGIQRNTATYGGSSQTGSGALWIGNNPDSTAQWWNGQIDGVRVFNYARSAAQIAWDYNRGAPVAHWKFDECQGDTAHDSSGNSNHGTITIGASGTQTSVGTCTGSSNTAWKDGATGKFNSSLDFDGTDDYVSVTDNPTSLGSSYMTTSAWVYTSAVVQAASIYNRRTVGNIGGMTMEFNNAQRQLDCYFYISDGWRRATSTSTISLNSWNHIACTYDGSTIRTYINGVPSTTVSISGTINNPTSPSVQIGNNVAGASFWNGQIDDVRVYNYALTPVQVKLLYNQNSGIRFGPATGMP